MQHAVAMTIISLAVFTVHGCASISNSSVYSGTGTTHDLHEPGVELLGALTSCQGGFCEGQWPMSLAVAPPASTYQAALRKKAAREFQVPESEVVLGEITVGYYSEINGTIRGWTATAPAGRKTHNQQQ